MGVNIFLLDRRTATLFVGGSKQVVGTLRRFFKITELDDERATELDATIRVTPSPAAALVVDVSELPLADMPDKPVAAHLVLGWDDGRGSVADFGWDYLPQLGYAVRDRTTGHYTLHEERAGVLHPIDHWRARELGLVTTAGELVRRGQPRIVACRSVTPFIPGYAEADCVFDSGVTNKLLIATPDGEIPPEAWVVGKRPMDVERYRPNLTGPHPRRSRC
ncbi:MAG: hypothetical protein AB7F35_25045 [Acetobacteraceae bacterium]